MKVSAVSGDLLVKVGIGVLAVGAAVYLLHRVKTAAAAVVPYIDPTDRNNVAYHTVNEVGEAIVTDPNGAGKNADGSWSLGGWLYDVTHPGTVDSIKSLSTGAQ